MMGVLSAVSVAEIAARGSIDNADVLRLRRQAGAGGGLTAEGAEALLALNHACPVHATEWAGWFVETLADYIVDQVEPEGYLTADNAAWLMARIGADRRVATGPAMELVLGVLDRARWVPASFVHFALNQVKSAVVGTAGGLGNGKSRTVGEAQTDLVRRILCAFDTDGHLPVTRPEAAVLLDLDAATAAGEHHPSWRDLFVKAMANCALAASGYATPPRRVALAATAAVGAVGGLRPPPSRPCRADPPYRLPSSGEREIARLARRKIGIVTQEALVLAEAQWFADRIASDGRPTPNGRALLLVLRAAGPALHPSLQALVDRVASPL